MRDAVAAVIAAAALVGCGEPAIAIDIPQRDEDAHVADVAMILSPDVEQTVAKASADSDLDIAVLTYETPQASCGEAFRAGAELVQAWSADVAVVAVARPGDFSATGDTRERCVGVRPRDEALVSGGLRERIATEVVPPLAASNRWDDAIEAAVSAIAQGR